MIRKAALYVAIVAGSVFVAVAAAEIYLRLSAPAQVKLPFYNHLYPYVMFRPLENASYVSQETFAMSHFKQRAWHYTNADGLRVPSPAYDLPRDKPGGQVRIAVLGGSAVQLASTFELTLPGSLRALLRKAYPGRDIEVINAGIVSCVSRQSIAHLIFTVVDYHPDVVILYDGANDLFLPMTYESRPNFPYNFQTLEEAWDAYRDANEAPLARLFLSRSYLYRSLKQRLHGGAVPPNTAADAARGVYIGPNAMPAGRIARDPKFVSDHVAAYLSNWKRLNELAAVYHYRPICVLQPAAALDPAFATPFLIRNYHLDSSGAATWIRALTALYEEADVQLGRMRESAPAGTFISLKDLLRPANSYFWDLFHVYDEVNVTLAERIYQDARPVIEECFNQSRK
jgi:hypothetical protein